MSSILYDHELVPKLRSREDLVMRLLALMTITLVLSPSASFAGNCSCAREIPNASAIVTDSCAKIWASQQCTLKETGTAKVSADWQDKVQQLIPNHALSLSAPDGDYRRFYDPQAGFKDASVLNYAILSILQGQTNETFAAEVIDTMQNNSSNFLLAFHEGATESFQGNGVNIAVGNGCLAARSTAPGDDTNFYLNFADGPCMSILALQ